MKTLLRWSPPTANDPLKTGYFSALDGLRGVAVLLVMVYHDFHYIPFLNFGWIGVDIFFVLSGFLITFIFLSNREKPHPVLFFYRNRILRVFPLYYLSLLILLFIVPSFTAVPGSGYYKANQWWLWTFMQNWLYIFKPVPTFNATYLVHFWSLALEEQYYLVWPWILISIRKPRALVNFIAVALLISFTLRFVVWKTGGNDFSLFYYFTCTRIEGLSVGSLLAIGTYFKIPNLGSRILKTTLATLVFCLLVISLKHLKLTTLPFFGFGGYMLIAMGTALLIHFYGRGQDNFLLNNRWLISIGKISFGLYVIHWPLYLLLSTHIEHLFLSTGAGKSFFIRIITSLICILLTVILAYISYYRFETYFLKLKKRLPFSVKEE